MPVSGAGGSKGGKGKGSGSKGGKGGPSKGKGGPSKGGIGGFGGGALGSAAGSIGKSAKGKAPSKGKSLGKAPAKSPPKGVVSKKAPAKQKPTTSAFEGFLDGLVNSLLGFPDFESQTAVPEAFAGVLGVGAPVGLGLGLVDAIRSDLEAAGVPVGDASTGRFNKRDAARGSGRRGGITNAAQGIRFNRQAPGVTETIEDPFGVEASQGDAIVAASGGQGFGSASQGTLPLAAAAALAVLGLAVSR